MANDPAVDDKIDVECRAKATVERPKSAMAFSSSNQQRTAASNKSQITKATTVTTTVELAKVKKTDQEEQRKSDEAVTRNSLKQSLNQKSKTVSQNTSKTLAKDL